jgi:hypothetical protein
MFNGLLVYTSQLIVPFSGNFNIVMDFKEVRITNK